MPNSLFDYQVRYLELRLAECQRQPSLHQHQLVAYADSLREARATDDDEHYLLAADELFPINQAGWLDRHRNAMDVYRALGDTEKLSLAERLYDSGAAARSNAELSANTITTMRETMQIERELDEARDAIGKLAINLLEWVTDGDARRKRDRLQTIDSYWRRVRAIDPACTWERVCAHVPYRNRLPFDDERLAVLGSWLRDALGASADRPATPQPPLGWSPVMPPLEVPPPRQPGVPTAQQAVAGYRAAYASIDAADPLMAEVRGVYEEILTRAATVATSTELHYLLASEHLFTRLARVRQLAVVEDNRRHFRTGSQPHALFHFEALSDTLAGCTSPTQIEREVLWADECLAVEGTWHDVFVHYALRPVAMTLRHEAYPDDASRATLAHSAAAAQVMFGRDYLGLLATPRVWSFFTHELFAMGQTIPGRSWQERRGVRGQVGLPIVLAGWEAALAYADRRSAEVEHVDEPHREVYAYTIAQTPRFASAEAMRDHLAAVYQSAVAGGRGPDAISDPPPGLRMWGTPVALEDVLAVAVEPPRPSLVVSEARAL